METSNKTQIWVWTVIILATILIIVAAVILVLNKVNPERKLSELNEYSTSNKMNENIDSIKFELDLQKSYLGTMIEENGSIQAVSLDIKNVNKELNSFDYLMNISVKTKSISTGSINFSNSTIYSSEFGELSYSVDKTGRILLSNSNKNQFPKFELSEELK